ncbi:hypothetical protein UFOVP411_10 [uncultured Caudovirales phage]|uniref:Uncharacterized protein n=1 Tax=uncultured Caudovirales phage TaxID=2100421 RepID=A0A6J5M7C2_9CAUD|nr:hypothetical protein UFOVP411_10 [uncultured Caudovirales phage]
MAIQIINDSQLVDKATLPVPEEPKAEEATPSAAVPVEEPAATEEAPAAPAEEPKDDPAAELARLRAELEALKAAQAAPKEPEAEPETPEADEDLLADLLADPVKGVSKALQKALREEQKAQEALKAKVEAANAEVIKAVPDAAEISADPAYRAWVQADPRRAALAARAQKNLDVDVSVTLLSAFKEVQTKQAAPAVDQNQQAPLPTGDEALEDALASSGGDAVTEPSDNRVYRRADIQELAVRDPERYQALAAEFRQAYLEGRVR